MRIQLTIVATALLLAACSDNKTSAEQIQGANQPVVVSGDTHAQMTKNGLNDTTRQANDAWFVHRIVSVEDNSFGCILHGEFENKSDNLLHSAVVDYTSFLTPAFLESGATNEIMERAKILPKWGEPNLNPIKANETRPVSFQLNNICSQYANLTLLRFSARGADADGAKTSKDVRQGAPALIIDNQTDFVILRATK